MGYSVNGAFWAIRHGYAAHNAYQNRYDEEAEMFDPPLTSFGEDQARAAGEYFALLSEGLKDIERIICSPSVRCRKTAEAFLKAAGREDIPIIIEPLLAERLGPNARSKGPHKAELEERMRRTPPPVSYDFSKMAEGQWWPDKENETHEDTKARAVSAIEKYFSNGEVPAKTLFVTHYGWIKALTGCKTSNAEIMQIALDTTEREGKPVYKGVRSHFRPKIAETKKQPRAFDP